uniref:Uncharacterized protein n=1 Tax=Anguilla anguilla TaxID=7936 RepID=A0A0E9U089_ANGAN
MFRIVSHRGDMARGAGVARQQHCLKSKLASILILAS